MAGAIRRVYVEKGCSFCQRPGASQERAGKKDPELFLFLPWSLPAPPIGQTQPDANWQESLGDAALCGQSSRVLS